MTEKEVAQKPRKVVVTTDVRVIADLSAVTRWIRWDDYARIESALKDAAAEFNSFIRDHRSQDHVRLEVERVVQEQCSECNAEWDTMVDENGDTVCASCGIEVARD